MVNQKTFGLSGNQLKLIALVSMTLDHLGLIVFGQYRLLRIIGRLAFPIFAWMIAEGCRHTRSMGKYLGSMVAVAALCQAVYFVAMGSLEMCIMVTFSLSVSICWLIRLAREKKSVLFGILAILGVLFTFFVTDVLPKVFQGTARLSVDYGFLGVMLPVALYLCKDKKLQLPVAAVLLSVMALRSGWEIQWFSLLSLPLLALYNGQRGKWKLKYLFYVYYPIHLAALWLLQMVLYG